MRHLLASAALCCLAAGCQRAPANVDDVAQHPLLQRPPAADGRAEAPAPKPPSPKPPPAPAPAKQPTPKKPLTTDEAVALASDPAADKRNRYEGWQTVARMKGKERDAAMRRIANTPAYEVAALAARDLIRTGAPDAVEVVCRRLPDWSAHERLLVLSVVGEETFKLDAAKPGLRDIPRRVLACVLKEGPAKDERKDGPAPEAALIDACAMVLSPDATPEDKQLLRQAAERNPRCVTLWLVLGRLDALTAKEEQLARKTYQDEALPALVRAAAATALSGRDAAAAGFAEARVRAFLSRYGPRYGAEEVKAFGKDAYSPAGLQKLQEFGNFRREEGLVLMLHFLQSPAAEALAFEASQCPNVYLRPKAAAVAASRWPKRFLDGERGALDPHDYANLLALIAAKQPPLRDAVLRKIGERELDEARARLRQGSASPRGGLPAESLVFLFS